MSSLIYCLTCWFLATTTTTTTTFGQFLPDYPQSSFYNPYHHMFRFENPPYGGFINYHQPYPPFQLPFHGYQPSESANFLKNYLVKSYNNQPFTFPPFNILEDDAYLIQSKFTSVPMIIASGESMRVFSSGKITEISKTQPTLIIKTKSNRLIEATPGIKIVLDKPILATSLKTNIMFPSVIEIKHEGVRIPVKVGVVVVPVPKDTVVSEESPVIVRVVYALATTPLSIDYVNNDLDVKIDDDTQSVVVEGDPTAQLPPKNVTILEFPDKEADPPLQIDEDDDSLVNRNPPVGIVPAGIVQSTQPHATVQEFHNPKESAILTQLREEAAQHRLKNLSRQQ